ncbi:hypothetical protein [Gluconobacter kanchanaburiensis]|uniref:Poly A polymerase head domain-containing protein n=1 Tax=Gluconobacter kanchanaburiensis NBRC 103587 TaxID=1307948 RepID=A0A511B655_9PROT|nr:hypothetical protein [Gluconobacter kanchanaburiensis]MBF0861248.1 hypothetical protein [Gluconobacter kanchanaburiensis]GBR70941.1 hypothetical protein AA103587_2135 [Gluconobacter kanchanaburiensis NBRC 103587]GEK95929.1 hypothetical protein GKA01_11260 [Gluconobacter kanchanaburiensis NBRC 103587]
MSDKEIAASERYGRLNSYDLRRALMCLPKDVLNVIKDGKLFLAGGYLRACVAGEPISDIDILSPNRTTAEKWAQYLSGSRGGREPWHTKNAITLSEVGKTPVQFIHRWTFNAPEEIIESFDFTVAQAVIWYDGAIWKSLVSSNFYQDLAAKRLRYTFPNRHEDAGGSLLRVQKFLKRGYDISPENLAKVISRLIGGVREDSPFWQGTEEYKATILASLLRQVDPLHIIDGAPSEDCLEDPSTPERTEFDATGVPL